MNMIYGMGCDLISVDRVRRVFFNETKLSRCFTAKEILLFDGQAERIAGNFAAKEAVAKALGTGFRGFALRDLEILRDELGRPFVSGDALKRVLAKIGVHDRLKVHISISHEKEFAMATCIMEKVVI